MRGILRLLRPSRYPNHSWKGWDEDIEELLIGGDELTLLSDAKGDVQRVVNGAAVSDGESIGFVEQRLGGGRLEGEFAKAVKNEPGIRGAHSLLDVLLPHDVADLCE